MGYFIAVFGAFNVKSFGDSLFPVALYKELSKRIEIDGMVLSRLKEVALNIMVQGLYTVMMNLMI